MTRQDTGDWPAFPVEELGSNSSHGMSMRDWFAGQALAGLLTDTQSLQARSSSFLAEWAYDIANAMLAAREEKTR